jgi:hypothetical protein
MADVIPLYVQILDEYRKLITRAHPTHVAAWPILSGYDAKSGTYNGWLAVIYEHTANPVMKNISGLGELSQAIVGVPTIEESNKELVRAKLEKHFRLKGEDGVVLIDPHGNVHDELLTLKSRHEFAMNLISRKIFLSHKSVDKPLVREYHRILQLLGFEPWLDEDTMFAGAELERALLQGFKDSCAAVFFVTPNFSDENFLATEVNYAIAEKRNKGDRFAIITLAFSEYGKKARSPNFCERTFTRSLPAS